MKDVLEDVLIEKEEDKIPKNIEKNNKDNNKPAKNIILMDFMATWCGPCKMQDPILEVLKKKYENIVEFKRIDIDKDGKLADNYFIQAVPTLIIEKDGKIFKKYVGVTSVKRLEEDLIEALK